MAVKTKTVYVCSNCGATSAKWNGRCSMCGEWNTLEEDVIVENKGSAKSTSAAVKPSSTKLLKDITVIDEHRYLTNISELDRVFGGGIVKGSVTLLSGDPGIGKSTILLQICSSIDSDKTILYVSGEESPVQIKLRAERLNVNNDKLLIMSETDTVAVCEYIKTIKPDIVMIDSIQTMHIDELSSSSGSIVQVRESAALILRTVKDLDIPAIIVSHVNKGGEIAGPKVVEHIVDTVLYFEGERNQAYRILRAVKNRFGSTNEIGVFEMQNSGLVQVENPSQMLLSERNSETSGTVITCVLEGTRPILAEVQGLVAKTGFGNPRRMSTGFDNYRLNLLLAVLEKRMRLYFSNYDTYLNVVGGIRLDEPAADLAVVLSLVSGIREIPLDPQTVVFGEVGLSGEVRSVPRAVARVLEAERLGFTKCILPQSSIKQFKNEKLKSIELIGVRNIRDAVDFIK